MQISDLVSMSLETLQNNRLRTFLTVLGITIGIAALTATLTLMEGTNRTVDKTLSGFGGKFMAVYPEWDEVIRAPKGTPFDLEDAQAISGVSGVTMLSLQKTNWWVPVNYNGKKMQTDIIGTDANFAVIRNRQVEKGRFIDVQDITGQRRICVITEGIKKRFFPTGDYLNQKMEIRGMVFSIVGCLQSMDLPTSFGSGKEEGEIYIPITTSQNMFGEYFYDTMFLRYDKSVDRTNWLAELIYGKRELASLKGRISRILRFRKGEGSEYVLKTLDEFAEQQKRMALTVSVVLCSVAGLCLIVGGIGIMNIMLVTVMERTREIGVRKAIGARNHEILSQFLTESVVIAAIGGAAGMILGVVSSRVVALFVGMPVSMAWWIPALGVGFMLAVGIGFGYYPARKAASILPIECLRYE